MKNTPTSRPLVQSQDSEITNQEVINLNEAEAAKAENDPNQEDAKASAEATGVSEKESQKESMESCEEGSSENPKKCAGMDREKPKRVTDNSNIYSGRMPGKWFALVEILKAKHPGKKIGDLLTDTLERGMENEEEEEMTATVFPHPTLDGGEYIRIRADYAPIPTCLKSFRADLLQIDQYPDDSERTERIAGLFAHTEDALDSSMSLNSRLGRIALLPKIPSGDDFTNLIKLKATLLALRVEADSKDERAPYTLGLKLIGPYLP